MRINTDKTQILIFKHSRSSNKITIPIIYQNKKIHLKPEPYIEVLGLFIDQGFPRDFLVGGHFFSKVPPLGGALFSQGGGAVGGH